MAEDVKAENLKREKRIASSQLVIGVLMLMAGLGLAAASLLSVTMIAGLIAGPLVFLLGIIVAGHSLQRAVRIKKEEAKRKKI